MSKPRYKWWSYAKTMIRDYPALCREFSTISEANTSVHVKDLPTNRQREYEAVRRAIVYTQHRPGAYQRMQLIDLLFWKNPQTLTFVGVARQLYISVSTAKRYSADFILLVGKNYGFFD